MYARGDGVPKDPVEALAWFQTAAHLGHHKAAGRVNSLRSSLRPAAVAEAENRFQVLRSEVEAGKKTR